MAQDKLSMDQFTDDTTYTNHMLNQTAEALPSSLTAAEIAVLTNANPSLLRNILNRVPTANSDMRHFLGGIAAAGAREAKLNEPPQPDVADAYVEIARVAVGAPRSEQPSE